MKKRLSLLALVLFLLACFALEADEAAQAIVRRVDQAERSASARLVLRMEVRPADGGSPRLFSLRIFERSGQAEASLVEFLEPPSVRGLRVLGLGGDSWVFFPSTGRVRKIAGSSRSGSVQGVGGDFSYEDLGGAAWAEDYDFKLLSESPAEWQLEGRRSSAKAAYEAVRLKVDRSLGLISFASFFKEAEGGWYKELRLSDFRDFKGRTRAASMEMRNLKKGSSTAVTMLEAAFDIALEDRLFDPARFGN